MVLNGRAQTLHEQSTNAAVTLLPGVGVLVGRSGPRSATQAPQLFPQSAGPYFSCTCSAYLGSNADLNLREAHSWHDLRRIADQMVKVHIPIVDVILNRNLLPRFLDLRHRAKPNPPPSVSGPPGG